MEITKPLQTARKKNCDFSVSLFEKLTVLISRNNAHFWKRITLIAENGLALLKNYSNIELVYTWLYTNFYGDIKFFMII